MLNEHLTQRSRWGGDRICPNGPDEGTSKSRRGEPSSEGRRLESESKPKVCEQARP